jgi:hypothetical protein
MHDDDGFDDEEQKGKIFYSGINPDADRADYALPRGEPALHDGEAEFDLKDPSMPTQSDSSDPTPRSPLSRTTTILLHAGVSLAASILFCSGFVLGWSPGSSPESPTSLDATTIGETVDQTLFGWATKLAGRPVTDLIKYQKPFLAVVEMQAQPENIRLWRGVERLARVSIVESPANRPEMIRSILRVLELPGSPKKLATCVRDLNVALADALEGR